jgi:hypothetical protein
MALYWILGIVVGVFFVSVMGVYFFSMFKELPGHRGGHSFEGGPIKESERKVWGDPAKISPPARRLRSKRSED